MTYTCGICLEKCDFSLDCKHNFHLNCLYCWTNTKGNNNSKCPYCMKYFDKNALKLEYLKSLSCDDENIIKLIDIPGVKINNSYILFYIKDIEYWIEFFSNIVTCVSHSELKKKYNTTISTKIFKIKKFIVGFVFETNYMKIGQNIYNNHKFLNYEIENKKEIQMLENVLKSISNFDIIEKNHKFSMLFEKQKFFLKSSCEKSKIKIFDSNGNLNETQFETIYMTGCGKFVIHPKLCIINSPEEKINYDMNDTQFIAQLATPMSKFRDYDGIEYYANTGVTCFISYNTIHAEIKHQRICKKESLWKSFFDERIKKKILKFNLYVILHYT